MKKLEEYKAFNVVAWATVIGFAAYTLNLALVLGDSQSLLALVS